MLNITYSYTNHLYFVFVFIKLSIYTINNDKIIYQMIYVCLNIIIYWYIIIYQIDYYMFYDIDNQYVQDDVSLICRCSTGWKPPKHMEHPPTCRVLLRFQTQVAVMAPTPPCHKAVGCLGATRVDASKWLKGQWTPQRYTQFER